MSELLNEAGNGVENEVVSPEVNEKPVSVRDALRAAMNGEEGDGKPSADARARDEAGRFAQKPAEQAVKAAAPATQTAVKPAAAPTAAPAQQAAPAAQNVQPTPAAAPAAVAPPPGWSPEAKADFANLPAHVQQAVAKREQEIEQGFKVLQDYKGLEQFSPFIKAAGSTHATVMKKALDYEAALQRDPAGTVMHVARIAGVDLVKLAHLIQQNPQAAQQQAPRPQPQPQVNVEQTVEQVLRKRDTENQIQSFLSDPANPHAEAVIDDIVALISTGRATSLKDAYDAACWMRPDIRQQLISQAAPTPVQDPQIAQRAAAADQARKASRSVTGSSSAGASRDAGAVGKSSSVRDALREAMATSGGRI